MKSIKFAMAALTALLSTALVAGPATPAGAAPAAAPSRAVAAADPYAPKIPTECRVSLAGKAKIGKHRYEAGATLKVRFKVVENSPREMRTPVKFKLAKGGNVVDRDRARYAGDPRKYRIAKVKKGKYSLSARTKDGENSRFEDCSAKIRFRVVKR